VAGNDLNEQPVDRIRCIRRPAPRRALP
jgi:hypothetical protein